MTRTWVASILSVLVLASFSSCGGGSGSCANTPACGGNIVGTWKITSVCASVSGSMFDMDCPGASTSGILTATGTYTFGADMTYTENVLVSGSVTVGLPASCLMSGGMTFTCDALNAVFATGQAGLPAGSTAHCVSSGGGGCNCTVMEQSSPSMETGTYTTTSAGLLTLTANGSTTPTEEDNYCVSGGNTLTLSPTGSTAMMGGEMASGTITFTKQ